MQRRSQWNRFHKSNVKFSFRARRDINKIRVNKKGWQRQEYIYISRDYLLTVKRFQFMRITTLPAFKPYKVGLPTVDWVALKPLSAGPCRLTTDANWLSSRQRGRSTAILVEEVHMSLGGMFNFPYSWTPKKARNGVQIICIRNTDLGTTVAGLLD